MHSIDAKIIVDAPVDKCFETWMDFEKFPTFMRRVMSVKRAPVTDLRADEHAHHVTSIHDPQRDAEGVVIAEVLHEVAVHGDRVWHWEIKGPLGQIFQWTAGIVMNIPNKAISWSTLPEEKLPNTGTVNFLRAAESKPTHERTLITVTMTFSAPVGIVGEFLSDVTHYGDNLLYEGLEDFKAYMEQIQTVDVLENGSIEAI